MSVVSPASAAWSEADNGRSIALLRAARSSSLSHFFSTPNWRRRGDARRTSFATGSPPRAMVTSSPRSRAADHLGEAGPEYAYGNRALLIIHR